MINKFLKGILLFYSLVLYSCTTSNNEQSLAYYPNIIIVLLDDMGNGDISLTGAIEYETPNITQLAKEGIFFTNYYAPQAVCSASRAGLLTGCYPNRIGLHGALGPKSERGLHENETTIAELLKTKGYSTAIYGKWHLGHHKKFLPTNHGFDEFYGIPYSNDMWPYHPKGPNAYPDLPLFENDKIVNNAVTPEDQKQFTRLFTKRATDFIKENRNNPFFIYLAHPQPHVPLFVSDKFEGKSNQGLYGDVMMEIDWSVGRLVHTLDSLNLTEETLVIFTSDNGPWLNYGNHAGTTGGLREGKGGTFEGGQRVPCIMKWKGTIPQGEIRNNIVSGIDILPSIASIVDANLPEHKIDGTNMAPVIYGNQNSNPRETFYYYYRRNNFQAIRHGKWKLVFEHGGRSYEGFEPGKNGMPGKVNFNHPFKKGLYNLRRDPGERYNVIDYHPEIVQKLETLANKARMDLGDELQKNEGKNRRNPGTVNTTN